MSHITFTRTFKNITLGELDRVLNSNARTFEVMPLLLRPGGYEVVAFESDSEAWRFVFAPGSDAHADAYACGFDWKFYCIDPRSKFTSSENAHFQK